MWVLFCKCFVAGFGVMLGAEIALGLCIAFTDVKKESGKK